MKFKYLLIAFVVLAAGCTKIAVYNVSGTWEGGDGNYVYIRQTENKQEISLDSALVENGRFSMSKPFGDIKEVTFNAGKNSMPFLLEETPVIVTCVMSEWESSTGEMVPTLKITIEGGPEQDLYREFLNTQKNELLLMLGLAFMAQGEDVSQALIDSTANLYVETQKRNDALFDSLVVNNPDRVASAIILGNQYKKWGLERTEALYDKFTAHVKEADYGKKIEQAIEQMKSLSSGASAPDFTLSTPDGNAIQLSDFRGKYVLLDFWASWCGPCLREVPNVKKVYDAYHDKGFEILGISLDEDGEAWENAIKSHGLNWVHVSSLKGWTCPVAKEYNVSGIPAMFLIDPSGNIIDNELRGDALEEKLSKIFDGKS